MTRHADIRGAAPVGQIADLPPLEAAAVACLRLWCAGAETQQQVWNDFAAALGAPAGRSAVGALEDLCDICVRHGRRALMRHQPSCMCLGADEACFANLVASAAEGRREDALLIAILLVRPDVSPQLAAAAQTFGLALKRMALRANRGVATVAPRQLH